MSPALKFLNGPRIAGHFLLCLLLLSTCSSPVFSAQESNVSANGTVPAANARFPDGDDPTDEQDASTVRRLEIITYLIFIVFGASIGSFLNVVIYRLPNGRSLIGPSKCPQCDEKISFRDNVPVLGWMRLLGRCRNCKVRIPMRYPAVEALIGAIFVSLLHFELLSGGENLPVRDTNFYKGVIWIIWYTKWDLIGIYLFHCCLCCVLVAASLIQWDGYALPKGLKWFALGTGIVAPVFWRHLHPVSFHEPRLTWLSEKYRWQMPFDDPASGGWTLNFGVGIDGFLDSLTGLVAGLATGWMIVRCQRLFSKSTGNSGDTPLHSHPQSFIALFGIVATYLGWQSVGPLSIGVAGLLLIFGLVSKMTGNACWRTRTTNAAVALATVGLLLPWRRLSKLSWCPDHTGWPMVANQSWWPSQVEPYASILLAVASGWLITVTYSFIANRNRHDSGEVPA